MDVFNNREIPGYEELVSYGPSWWAEYKEMDAVYRFAGWTLDLMAMWLEKLILNQFPAYADKEAIAVFEKILRIESWEDDSLEERRRTVAATLQGSRKFSASEIMALIRAYSGCSSEVWWQDTVLHIRISLIDEVGFLPGKISTMIDRKMPAHIAVYYRFLETVFETVESGSQRLRFQTTLGGWEGSLDGRFLLNSARYLNAEITSESAAFAFIKNGQREVL